jgi:hypothetical protein
MKLFSLLKHANRSFASVFLAFSLFGFLWPHHANSATGHHKVNLLRPSQVQESDDDSWYTPSRSPGFHEDFGS